MIRTALHHGFLTEKLSLQKSKFKALTQYFSMSSLTGQVKKEQNHPSTIPITAQNWYPQVFTTGWTTSICQTGKMLTRAFCGVPFSAHSTALRLVCDLWCQPHSPPVASPITRASDAHVHFQYSFTSTYLSQTLAQPAPIAMFFCQHPFLPSHTHPPLRHLTWAHFPPLCPGLTAQEFSAGDAQARQLLLLQCQALSRG